MTKLIVLLVVRFCRNIHSYKFTWLPSPSYFDMSSHWADSTSVSLLVGRIYSIPMYIFNWHIFLDQKIAINWCKTESQWVKVTSRNIKHSNVSLIMEHFYTQCKFFLPGVFFSRLNAKTWRCVKISHPLCNITQCIQCNTVYNLVHCV